MIWFLMSEGIGAPVIAGLAVGVGFIALFAIFVPIMSTTTGGNGRISVTIDGLKGVYKVGEVVDPVIRLRGYGSPCFSPNVAVRDTQSLNVVWASRTALGTCEMKPQEISFDIHPADIGTSAIIIDKPGAYRIAASAPGSTIIKDFEVVR